MHSEQENPQCTLRFQHQGAGVSFSFQNLFFLKHQMRQWQAGENECAEMEGEQEELGICELVFALL